jgi:hypothetical protein
MSRNRLTSSKARREYLSRSSGIDENPPTRAREIRALECAIHEYPKASRIIITLASEWVRDRPAGIQILPAADWFLTAK